MLVNEAITFAEQELKKNNILNSRLDSEILVSHLINIPRENIYFKLKEDFQFDKVERLKQLINSKTALIMYSGFAPALDAAVQPKQIQRPAYGLIDDVLHTGREEHRQAAGLEDVVALVSHRAAFGHVVVTRHRQHPAPRRGASHVGVLEDVRATVHPWTLAVPDAKHAIEAVAARWRKTQLLRAPQGGGGQLFVDAGLKDDVLGLQVLFGPPQSLVISPQG